MPVSDAPAPPTALSVPLTRSQLLESGRLLEEAEHSFGTVTAGFEDARGTIAGLSARLDQKTKSLLEAERGLRVSKAEAIRLKKVTVPSHVPPIAAVFAHAVVGCFI